MKNRRRKWRWMAAILSAALLITGVSGWNVSAEPQRPETVACSASFTEKRLVPVGRTVGLKLFSHGVMIVGLDEVPTDSGVISPAKECGLKIGDIITQVNGQPVNTIEEMEEILSKQGASPMALSALRGGKQLEVTTTAVSCAPDGSYKLGAWIRDSMAGIGTITWYDPESKQFCALGHGINDIDTGLLMPLKDGGIMSSSVTGILKGSSGSPGQLHGSFDLSCDIGTLTENTSSGVFGTVNDDRFNGTAFPLATRSEVKTGKATILSNIDGDSVQEYSVEILRIYPENGSDTRNLMVQVTDKRLLEATGGIVQGQSGSPILQNGKLVGAVTHVLVNDPTRGYGILIENMLDSAE